jgi:hypothetical protein
MSPEPSHPAAPRVEKVRERAERTPKSTKKARGSTKRSRGSTNPMRESTERAPEQSAEEARNGLGTRASKLVEEAALILEEELAMGIDVARNVEQRLFGEELGAQQNPEAVVQRFRRDAHDIVDLAVDVIGRALSTVGSVADRTVRIGGDVTRGGDRAGGSAAGRRAPVQAVSTLVIPHSIAAGETAEIAMQVENDASSATELFELNASDLVSDNGGRIPARNVKFEPAALQIPAHQTERIAVKLRVPEKVTPGTYSGLLQATKLQPVRAVLVVKIA